MTDFEAMSVYDAGEDDILNTEAMFNREYPSMTITKGSMNYLTYQSGSSNKYHIFFVAQDKSGNYCFQRSARIGYSPKLHRAVILRRTKKVLAGRCEPSNAKDM